MGVAILASLVVPATMFADEQTPESGEETTPAVTPEQPSPSPSPAQPSPPDEQGRDGQAADPSVPGADLPDQIEDTDSVRAPAGQANFRASAAARATSVSAGDDFFAPSSITIGVGETVRWSNDGQVPHTVTANDGGFDSGNLDPGQGFSHGFGRPGKFQYFCAYHANMKGSVTVRASGSGDGGGSGSSSGGGDPGGGGGGGSSSSGGSGGSTATGSTAGGGSGQLPSTGLPLLPLAAAGLGLVLLGAILRRVEFY